MDKEKSVYKQGAENGLIFGIYLSIIFLLFIYAGDSMLLSMIGLLLILLIPLVTLRFLSRYYISHTDTASFGALWILGFITFLCGSMICGLVTYVWLEYIKPGFIIEQANAALAAYEQVPELKDQDFTVLLRRAIEEKILPTPIQFAAQMIWITTSLGIILSFIIAPIVKLLAKLFRTVGRNGMKDNNNK